MRKKAKPKKFFLATKPLQILIATAIKDQLPDESYFILAVIDGFSLSDKISDNIRRSGLGWDKVIWGKSKAELAPIIAKLKPKILFTDSDVGIKNLIYLTMLKLRAGLSSIFVYEEGVGTYRGDLYSGLKREILMAFGVGVSFGGSAVVDGTYVYDKAEYDSVLGRGSKSCVVIEKTVISILRADPLLMAYIFEAKSFFESIKPTSLICHIYLSSWVVDLKAINYVALKSGDKYIKEHPHIQASELCELSVGFVIAPRQLPAELVLGLLAGFYEQVFVYHHGSSVFRYIPESGSLRYRRLKCKG